MKNWKTPAAAFAAVAIAAALTALPGCSCTKGVTLPTGKPGSVNVQVQLTSAGIFVFPNSTHLGEGRQFPVWILTGAPDGSCLGIKFKEADPLEPEPPEITKVTSGPCKTVIRRGVPKRGTAGKIYRYGVTVTLPDGTTKYLDPDIEVYP